MKRIIRPAVIEGDGELELSIQDHLISQPLAEVGIRYSGKSYLAGKICEELCEAKQPFIVVDPEGEYWTLKQRYPVIVASIGRIVGRPKGYKADLTITAETAPVLARRIVEKGYTVVLDMKNAKIAEMYQVLGNFLEALYNAEAEFNRPLILIMEEAHVLVPEIGRIRLPEVKKAQDKAIYWTCEIAARGRHRGLGYICIARRAAEVSKFVLSQCPIRIIFKLVDPRDLKWLRESGLTSEEIDMVKKLPQGKALVIGIKDEHFIIQTKPRKCLHGGKTPIAKAVETPELETAIKDLIKILEVKEKPPSIEIEAPYIKKIKELEAKISELKGQIKNLLEENANLKAKLSEMEKSYQELKATSIPLEEKMEYEAKIKTLQEKISSLEEQLKKAAELEEQLERLRELTSSWFDLLIETSNILGLELIPEDIVKLKEELDFYKSEYEKYRRTEELRKATVQEVLEDPAIKNLIRQTKLMLRNFLTRKGAMPLVLKQALSMDPEISFLPEELETGVTPETNRSYLLQLVDKGLLWETTKKGRKAFRNRLKIYITEKIRKIKPAAPDEAINKIYEEIREYILK